MWSMVIYITNFSCDMPWAMVKCPRSLDSLGHSLVSRFTADFYRPNLWNTFPRLTSRNLGKKQTTLEEKEKQKHEASCMGSEREKEEQQIHSLHGNVNGSSWALGPGSLVKVPLSSVKD